MRVNILMPSSDVPQTSATSLTHQESTSIIHAQVHGNSIHLICNMSRCLMPSHPCINIIVTSSPQSASYRSSTSSHSSKSCPYMHFESMHPILHQSHLTSAPQCIRSLSPPYMKSLKVTTISCPHELRNSSPCSRNDP